MGRGTWTRKKIFRDAGAHASRSRRGGPVRGGARRRGQVQAADAAQDASLRDGGNVPGAAAGERRKPEGKALNNEKGPENRGLQSGTCLQTPYPGCAQATSFSSEQPFSWGRLSSLRSSSIDSP